MKRRSPTLERFGKNIVRYMKKRNISTDQLSARTKIPKRTIQHWMHWLGFDSGNVSARRSTPE